jgi:WD40 repeat protein
VNQRLRIFISSPGDVKAAREIAALTIERLAQDYARFFKIEPYLWEYEAMVASGHFQDSIDPPSAFDIVVLILWSRLGTLLPERTAVREYRGIDGRAPVTGTEWEFEEALQAAQTRGAPDLLIYRSLKPSAVDTRDSHIREQQLQQLTALDGFWGRHFANQGVFLGAYTEFSSDTEFAEALERHLRKLIERRASAEDTSGGTQSARVWFQAPFRGLESYDFEHAPIFFGQDDALTKAMMQLTANAEAGSPFLLVLGASGSGKSSLVKAGIVPKLFVKRRIPGAAFLRRVVFRPSDALDGEDLFDALARRLSTQAGPTEGLPELIGHGQSVSSLAAHLRDSPATPGYPIGTALGQLTTVARQDGAMLDYEGAKLVLVVDQLEELFTNERLTPTERERFVSLLSGLVRSGLVWVIATMRKDFWHHADATPELARMAEGNGRLELLPPTPLQLSQMMRRPAAAAGVEFERHPTTDAPLNEVIGEEVAREPGALPLLSYLLDQLYRADVLEAHGGTLGFATYERLGRLEGAIATKAEAVLTSCASEDRQALGSVLFSLVQMGTADGDIERAVSRRVPLATFPPGTPARRLVDALLHPDARLLVSDAEQKGHPTVRVAHEALITRWAQAREFIQGNAHALKVRRRIEERYALWRGQQEARSGAVKEHATIPWRARLAWRAHFGREPGLLSEIDLVDGQRLLREHRADTEPHLVDYIDRSAADDKRLRSRSVRLLSAVAGVVTVLAILASAAGLIASQKQREAELQTQRTLEAQSRLLTEAARGYLKDGDVPGAQGIIFEVLANRPSRETTLASAINEFQEARAADRQVAILFGHGATVRSAAFSTDGLRIVTASNDTTARVWDSRTGLPLIVLSGHGGRVIDAEFSPDRRRIVTASEDKIARIWDAETGKLRVTLSGHENIVNSAAFSPDGLRVVTASYDQTARVWDPGTGAQLAVLSGPGVKFLSAAFSPDGRRIVTAPFSASDRAVRIWDAASGRALMALSGHEGAIQSAVFSPDGRRIVSASDDHTARIWDAMSGAQLSVLSGHTDAVFTAAFSQDGRRIVTTSFDHTVRIWDAGSGTQLIVLHAYGDVVETSAVFSPDGQRIVVGYSDGTAWILDSGAGAQRALLSGHSASVNGAEFSPDGRRIVTASSDRTARIWDTQTGRPLAVLSGDAEFISAAFSPDGGRVVTAHKDGTARIWDATSGAQRALLSAHSGLANGATFSPDGRRIVTAGDDRTARIWDAESGRQVAVLSGHSGIVTTASFAPDGRRVVTASLDGTARIWSAENGQPVVVLSGHGGGVTDAAFSPDGRRIVTAGDDRTARIWDAATGKPLIVLSGHRDVLSSARFSPDGQRIVTGGVDKTARIWDAGSGQELAVLSGDGGILASAIFSPDGRRILTASTDKTARIWDATVPADLGGQVAWSAAAQLDLLPNLESERLGLPPDRRIRIWRNDESKCDAAAAAPYDPDRLASGSLQQDIAADTATAACTQELAKSANSMRLTYQLGRALLAMHDPKGARREFEMAVSHGYRAARLDLANLLSDSADMRDPARAVSLYEQAWQDGVRIAAFKLGRLYEAGISSSTTSVPAEPRPDLAKAWSWYEKGADAGEPNALARFAERDEKNALAEQDRSKQNVLLLNAFGYYAAAAERARVENWPDDAWRNWRYRRATLARLLAHEGMMQKVADDYTAVRNKWAPPPPTLWEKVKAKIGP